MTSVKPNLSLNNKVRNLESISHKDHLTEGVAGFHFPLSNDHLNARVELGDNEIAGNVSSLRLRGGGQSESEFEDEDMAHEIDIDNSMPEEQLRSILAEAGYTVEEINVIIEAREEISDSPNTTTSEPEISGTESDGENALDALKEIRIKNVDKVIIGTLNINSLPAKFDQLSEVVGNHLDILAIQETKLDGSYPTQQFALTGYSEPYRLDRNRDGGGVLIYVREDIPSKQLNKHSFTKNVEGLFLEINLRKTKLLFFGGYRSDHEVYGLSKNDFLEQLSFALDKYSSYEKLLIAGDFNIDREEELIDDFLFEQNFKNLVKDKTCFKSADNPSCIDLFLTNSPASFQNTTTVTTGLSDFHKMVVTVMKTTFPKAKPQILYYRDYKNFDIYNFRTDLRNQLSKIPEKNYLQFEVTFLKVLEEHAPMKKKVLRANNKPYMTKALRKAIMKRSTLENKFFRCKSDENFKAFKKQKNFTNRLAKRERVKYFANVRVQKPSLGWTN